jgi:phage tail-like protein
MASTASKSTVISSSHFVISIDGNDVAIFSDLSGINSEVEPVEYIASDEQGNVIHTKQFGKVKPPKVTLKRGLDGSKAIWAWHEAVLSGDVTALRTCALKIMSSATKDGKEPVVQITYVLENAWPCKVDIAGMKAGSTEVIMETVELVCDNILMQS